MTTLTINYTNLTTGIKNTQSIKASNDTMIGHWLNDFCNALDNDGYHVNSWEYISEYSECAAKGMSNAGAMLFECMEEITGYKF